MTTVVYRDGVLASDSLVTMGQQKAHGNYTKIHRVRNFLIGSSGSVVGCSAFLEWIKEDGDMLNPPSGNYGALIIHPRGRVDEVENGKYIPKFNKMKFHAIGSGAPYALAALYAGASAVEAVKIAIKLDTYSGLPVRKLTLKG